MVLSALAISVTAALAKLAAPKIPNQEIVALRCLATLVPILALMRWRGVRLRVSRPGLLLLRGVLGYVAITCWFLSLERLDLADGVMILYTSPVWVCLAAPLILKEPSGRRDWMALAVALAGAALVLRPGLGLDPAGAFLGLTASFCSAGVYMTVRAMRKDEDPLIIMLAFPVVASILSLAGAARAWVWPDLEGWILIAGIAWVTMAGQAFLTFGLMWEQAGRASVATYFAVVVSIPLGIVIFDQWPDPLMLAGGAMVIGAVTTLALASGRTVAPPVGAGAGQVEAGRPQGERTPGSTATGT